MPKSPRPAPFFACYLPDGTRLETAIARACAEGDAAIRAGADVHEAASAVEARISGLVRHVFAWGRNGAKLPAADPDAHAAASEAAEAARLDAEEAEAAERDAERDGTPARPCRPYAEAVDAAAGRAAHEFWRAACSCGWRGEAGPCGLRAKSRAAVHAGVRDVFVHDSNGRTYRTGAAGIAAGR